MHKWYFQIHIILILVKLQLLHAPTLKWNIKILWIMIYLSTLLHTSTWQLRIQSIMIFAKKLNLFNSQEELHNQNLFFLRESVNKNKNMVFISKVKMYS